jgi:cyclase
MNRTVIVAKIQPGAEQDVAKIFADSDGTTLPNDIGVRERGLFSLGDLYVHIIDFERDAREAMAIAQRQPGFADISARLNQFISPYSSTWRSPVDAMASRFYHWHVAD